MSRSQRSVALWILTFNVQIDDQVQQNAGSSLVNRADYNPGAFVVGVHLIISK